MMGWCCAVVAVIAAATVAARFATAGLLSILRRQRAKGTRVGVLAGGGAAVQFFFPSLNAYKLWAHAVTLYKSVPGIMYTC